MAALSGKPGKNQPDRSAEGLLKAGQDFGPFRIERIISLSGSAEVYEAAHRISGRRCALKVFPPLVSILDSGFPGRFKDITNRLKAHIHPGIAVTHHADLEGELYYIQTDYIDNAGKDITNLDDLLRDQKRLPEFQIKKIMITLCSTLQAAHCHPDHPLVHSNLKPTNILIDKNNRIFVSDIGDVSILGINYYREMVKYAINKSVILSDGGNILSGESSPGMYDRTDTEKTMSVMFLQPDWRLKTMFLTASRPVKSALGKFLRAIFPGLGGGGPAPDIAPAPDGGVEERDVTQAKETRSAADSYDYMSPEQKAGEEPTPRSNVYSAGLILYKMLTGRKLGGCWKMPSAMGLAPEWDYILLRSLQSNPEERYGSMAELEEAIERVRAKESKNFLLPAAAAAALAAVVCFFLIYYHRVITNEKTDGPPPPQPVEKSGNKDGVTPGVPKDIFSLVKIIAPEETRIKILDGEQPVSDLQTTARETVVPLRPGVYMLSAEKYGFEVFLKEINVCAGASAGTVTVSLEKISQKPVREHAKAPGARAPVMGCLWSIPKLDIEMIPIEPGSFPSPAGESGAAGKEREARLIKQPFWIGKTEITQAQYEDVMPDNPSLFKKSGSGAPADNVSFLKASEFCAKLTAREKNQGRLPEGYVYRLPSETEWEYCCRAESPALFCFGNNKSILVEYAWHEANSQKVTHQTGIKSPNHWGLHDMHGNVAEWCLPPPARGPSKIRAKPDPALRGGSWASLAKDTGSDARSVPLSDNYSDSATGFRIVLAPETPAE
jgi:formylglycine-generating enzyme required for sulfatase activity/serine/threonine protein kinase